MNTDNLIELRQDLGLKQYEMAKIIGVTQNSYSDYETGKSIIPIKRLNIISNKYNYSLDYLSGKERHNNPNFKHIEISNKMISKRLKQLRIESGLTQEYIAKKLKAGESTISDYENNKITITIPILIEYSKLTNKSIDYLCGKTEE